MEQCAQAIAIGRASGKMCQQPDAIAIGRCAGKTMQGSNSIAIGQFAGQTNQGEYSIAIGRSAGEQTGHNNTIILNAQTNMALNSTDPNSFYVKPIRNTTAPYMLCYNTGSGEISYQFKQQFFTFTENGTIQIPEYVKYYKIIGIGGGGGGGTGGPNAGGGSGGNSGQTVKMLFENTGNNIITFTIGIGGNGATSPSNDGEDGGATIANDGTNDIFGAPGGSGGKGFANQPTGLEKGDYGGGAGGPSVTAGIAGQPGLIFNGSNSAEYPNAPSNEQKGPGAGAGPGGESSGGQVHLEMENQEDLVVEEAGEEQVLVIKVEMVEMEKLLLFFINIYK
jgi:hypothetical protein